MLLRIDWQKLQREAYERVAEAAAEREDKRALDGMEAGAGSDTDLRLALEAPADDVDADADADTDGDRERHACSRLLTNC